MHRRLMTAVLMCSLALPTAASAGPTWNGAPVRLLAADAQGIVLELRSSDYTFTKDSHQGTVCESLQVSDGLQSDEQGRPQLPLQVVLLGVPPQAEVMLDVSPLETTRVPGSHMVCPAPERKVEQEEDGSYGTVVKDAGLDAAIYGEDRLYPIEAVQLEDLGFVRSQRIVRVLYYPFQVNGLSGEIVQHKRMRVELRFKGGTGPAGPLKEREELETALRSVLLNYEAAREWRGAPAKAASTAGWTPPDPGYKVTVGDEGIYELTYTRLSEAGLPVDTLDPRTLRVFDEGQEVAVHVEGQENGRFDAEDVVLVFGNPSDLRYTKSNVLWLTYGGEAGQRMLDKPSLPEGSQSSSYIAAVHLEENLIYISSLPMKPNAHHWYGKRIDAAGEGNPGEQEMGFTVDHMATEPFTATLEVAVAGNFEGWHHLRLYLNGELVHDGDPWFGRTVHETSVTFAHNLLIEGENLIRVETANDWPGQQFDQVYIDWLRVGYERRTVADGQVLAFRGDAAGSWQYTLEGFSGRDVELFDVTDPVAPERITGATVTCPAVWLPFIGSGSGSDGGEGAASTGSGATGRQGEPSAAGTCLVRFGDSHDGGRRYLALTENGRLEPLAIEKDNPSQLQSSADGADYIIITHSDFGEAVMPLAAHRSDQGLRVEVVDVEDAYDEFGYGIVSAEAIRDFIAYAYENWPEPAPSYVLLVGDGTYDSLHYLSNSGPSYIPPYLEMVDPDLGEAATDNRYGAVAGDDILADLSVGRLPVNSVAEAEVMVNKILSYETSPAPGDWTRNVLFVTDDLQGGGGNFYSLSDSVIEGYADPPTSTVKFLPESYVSRKIYLGQTCPDEEPSVVCRQEIVDELNTTGALLVSYIGHSTKFYWARERLMDYSTLRDLSNGDRLPIALPMTCLEGYFHEAQIGVHSLGEGMVRKEGGGAVASWSPTGLGVATGHDLMEKGYFLSLFHDGVRELGPATNQAKLYLLANSSPGRYDDLIDTYLVLGDPALKVHLAEP